MVIYQITNNITSDFYIGKSNNPKDRFYKHKYNAKNNKSQAFLYRAMRKYGVDNFSFTILEEVENQENINCREVYWIEKLSPKYNMTKGGDGGDTLSNHPELDLIKEKISKNNPKTGKTYEDAFGEVKANEYKEKLKNNIHKNILSIEVKQKQKEKWIEYNRNFKNRCEFIKSEIDIGKFDEYKDELKIIKSRVSHNFLRNADGFYNFFGENLRYVFGKLKINQDDEFQKISKWIESSDISSIINYMNKIPNRFFLNRREFYRFIGKDVEIKIIENFKNKRFLINRENVENLKIKILVDDVEYNSILLASKELDIDPCLIRYRLKSSHFKNYLFSDNNLNIKYNKYIDVDPHLSKKERVSIDGVEYSSITDATKNLNKPHDHINWRLNSKSYPNWFYLDKVVELKETSMPKLKSVSIKGVQYESISKAVEGSGIDRQIMRYRLKSNNHPEYFYI